MTMARRDFMRHAAVLGLLPLTAEAGPDLEPTPVRLTNWPEDSDPRYWALLRRQFSIPPDEAYFNTATLGACPRPVLEAMIDSMRNLEKTIAQYDYRPAHTEYIAGYRPQVPLREKAGQILNASAREIALVQNATMAINFIANGLELQPGDEVLLTDQEHPGAMGPWDLRAKRQGIVARKLPIPIPTPDPETVVNIFRNAIGPRTRVMAVPHVVSRYGIVLPVQELCALARERNLFTLIDGAQALGQLRVDVRKIGCDAYAASPHKWLLAPPGNGLLYVRAERQARLWPTLASSHWDDYDPADGVFRLMQFGTANAALLVGLEAALDFYQRVGPEKIEHQTIALADKLRAGLKQIQNTAIASPLHPKMAGAIVTYSVAGLIGPQLEDELWKRGRIRVREEGGALVRQSVHYYNSPEEIDATLAVVKSLARA